MEPSPLHFVSHTHYYRGGDVVVDDSAAIAPGVVLRAAPNASIRIGPGVCVGAGVVIQAKQGCVFIEAGVSVGTGVLIVGHGHVSKDACVGPSSTLINPAIAPSEIIPPCSLIDSPINSYAANTGVTAAQNGASPEATGFMSNGVSSNGGASNGFQANGFQASGFQASGFQASGFQVTNDPVPSMPMPPRTSPTVQPQAVSPKAVNVPDIGPTTSTSHHSAQDAPDLGNPDRTNTIAQNRPVYGRDHVQSLLSALFPHRQSLNNDDKLGDQYKNGS